MLKSRCFVLGRSYGPPFMMGLVATAVYGWLYSSVFRSVSITSDDHMFADYVQTLVPVIHETGYTNWFFAQDNHLAYGAMYWLVYGTLAAWTPDAFWVMRALSFAAALGIPLCYLTTRRANQTGFSPQALLATLLWFTFPCAWWTGKITGPEIFIMACIAMSFKRFVRVGPASLLGWFGIGAAIGLKFTALPVAVFFGVYLLCNTTRAVFKLPQVAACAALGFAVMNPIVLASPMQFIETSQQYSGLTLNDNLWANALNVLSNMFYTWDSLPGYGLTQWSLTPWATALGVLTLGAARVGAPALVASAVALAVNLAMLSCSLTFYGWYWFPIIALLPALIAAEAQLSITFIASLCVLVAANALGQTPRIIENLSLNAEHQRLLLQHDDMQRCLEASVPQSLGIQTILDRSDLDTNYAFEFLAAKEDQKLVIYTPRDLEIHDISQGKDGLVARGPTLLLIGDRFARRKWFTNFPAYVPQFLPGCRDLRHMARCGSIDLYMLQCRQK